MKRPLQLLHQISGPVVVQTRAYTQWSRADFKGRNLAAPAPQLERSTQQLVDHRLERPACPAHLVLQRGGDIVFQGQRGPHIMMLDFVHHDVNGAGLLPRHREAQIPIDCGLTQCNTIVIIVTKVEQITKVEQWNSGTVEQMKKSAERKQEQREEREDEPWRRSAFGLMKG